MGYETTLYFVDNWDKRKRGFLQVIGSLDLCKVAYGNFGDLLDKIRKRQKVSKRVKNLLDELRNVRNKKAELEEQIFWNGDTPIESDVKEKIHQKETALEHKLEKYLPFIFIDGNTQEFEDSYGEVLMIADLEEVENAIVKDQAKSIVEKEFDDGKGYRRFDTALKMIESFKTKDQWTNIKVVLWGH